ncbi:MAG: shikimate kinase [Firmicutes bacterium]|nr:shikimate kinase [Bacillota bacterium]
MIENRKRPFGLLGRKLGHSFSPEIHRTISYEAGHPYDYVLFEKEPEELEDFLKSDEWAGLNVTVPYKEEVIKYLDYLSDEAADIGAVNTIVRQDGKLVGYNTDYFGFMNMMDNAGVRVEECKCLVLGDGGASKAVQQALTDMGVREMVVMSRKGNVKFSEVGNHKDADVIINTTPVGMYPKTGDSLVFPGTFPKLKFAVDLIYNPLRTNFLLQAKKSLIEPVSGLEMLVSQAMYASMLFMGEVVEDRDRIVAELVCELRKIKQNIVLIGMPGVGKSTVGRILAEKLDRPIFDTDAMIVEKEGRQIPDIFRDEGEEFFRDLETWASCELEHNVASVISCGGGIIKREENYYFLAPNSFIVFLNRDITKLPLEGRPLSLSVPMERLYKERLPLYRSWCDAEIAIDDLSPEETADEILRLFAE